MSTAAHAHDTQGHHISSFGTYAAVFGALLVLTFLTVAVSAYSLFHGPMSLFVAMLVATVKASLVATWFMHMKWDHKFNVLVFLASLWFAGLFFTFTMVDLTTRTKVNAIQEHNLPSMEHKAEAEGHEALTPQH